MAEEKKSGSFCSQCGAKLEGEGKFCVACGAAVGGEEAPEEKPAKKEEKKPEKKEEKKEEKPAKKAEKQVEEAPKGGAGAGGLRLIALILWVLAIAFEILTICYLNGVLYIPGDQMVILIAGIALDLICVVIGSLLWKKANRKDPASKKEKFRFFIQNQLGVIVAILAFLPLVIILLRSKNLEPKLKKIVTIIAVIALAAAALLSADFDPPSQEDLQEAQAEAAELGDGSAYWTRWGKSYHFDEECQTLQNSQIIYNGTVEEAFDANRSDPCDFCAGG